MYLRDYLRIRRGNRHLFAQLFLTGECPETNYSLELGTVTLGAPTQFMQETEDAFPSAEHFVLVGKHTTVGVKVDNIWAMRNGNNKGSSNYIVFDGKSWYSRTDMKEVIELLKILTSKDLPLLLGAVSEANLKLYEERLKGGRHAEG